MRDWAAVDIENYMNRLDQQGYFLSELCLWDTKGRSYIAEAMGWQVSSTEY